MISAPSRTVALLGRATAGHRRGVAAAVDRRRDEPAADAEPGPVARWRPCCPYPDDWWQVGFGALVVAVLAAIALALVLLGVALAWVAVAGRPPGLLRRQGDRVGLVLFAALGALYSLPMLVAVALSLFG